MEKGMDTGQLFREKIIDTISKLLKKLSQIQEDDTEVDNIKESTINALASLHQEERKDKEGFQAKIFDLILYQKFRNFQTEAIRNCYIKFSEEGDEAGKISLNRLVTLETAFYDILFALFSKNICERNLIYVCIEELFQMIRTEDLESMLFLLSEVIQKSGNVKQFYLPLLRISNGILDRLSSTNDTEFIGQIHKLIANIFPLSHRSGVNFKGSYNKRITNEIEKDVQMKEEAQGNLLVNEISKESMLSYEFFENFWLLQKYISDPFQLFEIKPNNDFAEFLSKLPKEESEDSKEEKKEEPVEKTPIYKRFMEMVSHVLDVFENNPISEHIEAEKIEKRYPKFLSKYKLINLQFKDVHFRETFMIQLLILFQSFSQPSSLMQTKSSKGNDMQY